MSYFHTLLAEVCTGVAPEVNAKALAWGKQYEDDARALFEFTVGVQVWDGEGLPPVGCECEAKYRDATNAEWFFFRCVGVDCGVAFGWAGKDAVTLDKGRYEFRPFRSEADNKRAIGVTALAKAGGNVDFEYGRKTIDGELSSPGWYELYDKIAAGEVAGIRIE